MPAKIIKNDDIPLITGMYYCEMKTLDEIGELFNCNPQTISRWLRKNGFKPRQTNEAQLHSLEYKIDAHTLTGMYVTSGMSCDEIANYINSSAESVRRYLKKLNIKMRDKAKHLSDCIGGRYILKYGTQEEKKRLTDKISKKRIKYDIYKIANERNIEVLDEYDRSSTPIRFRCENGHIYSQKPAKFIREGAGCKDCRNINEGYTYKYLLDYFKVEDITRQYVLTTYKFNNKKAKIICDFVIKTKNKMIVVEYNGRQHYEPVEFNKNSDSKKAFKKQIVRDKYLRQYCKDNGILLLEIDGRVAVGTIIKKEIDKFIRRNKLCEQSSCAVGTAEDYTL